MTTLATFNKPRGPWLVKTRDFRRRRYYNSLVLEPLTMYWNGSKWVKRAGARGTIKSGAVKPPKGSMARQRMRQLNDTVYDPNKHSEKAHHATTNHAQRQ